jgi:hypothetical protein
MSSSRRRHGPAMIVLATAVAIGSVVVLVSQQRPATHQAVVPRKIAPSKDKLKPTDANYAQRVDWVTACTVAKTSADDPIMLAGHPGTSHLHDFSGNVGVSASSTTAQLLRQRTTCSNAADKSAYWMPALLVDGHPVKPYTTRAYYRAGTRDVAKIEPFPVGLRMIAGNPNATQPQSPGIAGFHCRGEGKGAVLAKQALPPRCPDGALLEASVVFPNCWDGKNLDSADHRAHMSYARRYQCDERHPVQIPQLTLSERFKAGKTSGTITLAAMNSPLTLHADFLDGWDARAMEDLVTKCIRASKPCATVDS